MDTPQQHEQNPSQVGKGSRTPRQSQEALGLDPESNCSDK